MEITLLQIYALKQNALSDGIQPVSEWGWCGESECAAPASWNVGIQELWGSSVPGECRGLSWGTPAGADERGLWPSQNLMSPFSSTLVNAVSVTWVLVVIPECPKGEAGLPLGLQKPGWHWAVGFCQFCQVQQLVEQTHAHNVCLLPPLFL